MLSKEHIRILEDIAKSRDDAAAAIKLLNDLLQQQYIEELRKELFGV